MDQKANVKNSLEQAKAKSTQDFHNRNVEERLKTLNVIHNFYSTMKEHHSTHSLSSRLKCNDAWIKDIEAAVKAKTESTRESMQATNYRVL